MLRRLFRRALHLMPISGNNLPRRDQRGGVPTITDAAAGILLAGLPAAAACATVAAAAVAVVRRVAVDYAEPVVYGQALRIVWGEPLYQPLDRSPLTVAAYTPLYYWAAATLQILVGPGFGPGRALSLACGIAAAIMVGILASRHTGEKWVGIFAGLLFMALGFPRDRDDTPWLGLYRVDLLGVALSLAAIAVLTWRNNTRAAGVAGILAGLALLCKPTFFAALLAGGLWLFSSREKGSFLAFIVSAAFIFAVPCALLQATTGAFVQNTVEANLNPVYLVVATRLVSVFVRTQWLPLLLTGAYLGGLGQRWWEGRSRLVVLYWAASSLWVLFIGNIGANYNYWIEFAAATAILAGAGAACLVGAPRKVLAAGLILVVATQLGGPPAMLASVRAVRSDLQALLVAAPDPEFDALVDRVRREPGAVLAEPMDVVVLGGRPVLFEPFIYSVRLDTRRWDPAPLTARICHGDFGLVVLGYSLEVAARMNDGLHALWPPPVLAALHDSTTLEGMMAGRYIYTPISASGPGCLLQRADYAPDRL